LCAKTSKCKGAVTGSKGRFLYKAIRYAWLSAIVLNAPIDAV
jgi:hypothetical protein